MRSISPQVIHVHPVKHLNAHLHQATNSSERQRLYVGGASNIGWPARLQKSLPKYLLDVGERKCLHHFRLQIQRLSQS